MGNQAGGWGQLPLIILQSQPWGWMGKLKEGSVYDPYSPTEDWMARFQSVNPAQPSAEAIITPAPTPAPTPPGPVKATAYNVGARVEGLYSDGGWYKATIEKINADGSYTLKWDDGDTKDRVKVAAQIRVQASVPRRPQPQPSVPSVQVDPTGWMAIINATMLIPYFTDQYPGEKPRESREKTNQWMHEKPRLRAVVHYGTTALSTGSDWDHSFGFNMAVLDPSSPALPIQWTVPVDLQFQMQVQVPPSSCVWFKFTVKKALLPKAGPYWGWPWEGDGTTADYSVARIGMTRWDTCAFVDRQRPKGVMLEFFMEEAIMVLKPRSILAQIGTVLSGMGGYMALLTTVFFVFFVKAATDADPSSDPKEALTLRFLGEKLPAKQGEESDGEDEEEDEEQEEDISLLMRDVRSGSLNDA